MAGLLGYNNISRLLGDENDYNKEFEINEPESMGGDESDIWNEFIGESGAKGLKEADYKEIRKEGSGKKKNDTSRYMMLALGKALPMLMGMNKKQTMPFASAVVSGGKPMVAIPNLYGGQGQGYKSMLTRYLLGG